MKEEEKFIQINNLGFSYQEEDENKKFVIDGVSFYIKKGEYIAIVGRNGSGKSTLALNLNCLLIPTQGSILVDGLDTKDENNIWKIRKKVGMVFQNPDNQLVSSIIEDDVAFGPENIGIDPAEIRTRVDDALAKVKMQDYAKKSPHLLSGGQKQRVAIAGVIAMKPECIIFDEATAMLDPKGRQEIMSIIKDLHNEGHTIIAITHFMQEACYADRIVVMDHGKVAMIGTPEEVFSDKEKIEKLDLEMPFAIKLCDELRKKGLDIPKNITNERKLADYLCSLK